MSEPKPYKLVDVCEGHATVVVDGVRVGRVQYHEDRYNLRRLIINREWWAIRDGKPTEKHFGTRKDAAQWLASNAGKPSQPPTSAVKDEP